MVHVGTKHETKETNGIAHFIEHLLFKNQLNFRWGKELSFKSNPT
ncbi:hypothetical protein B4113_2103 [Geobacillus sp. B4113_201601]|nr:hypothetical protein B4113_2103 [Geobacillus sp. B4113_201601]